ncbi:MAG: glycosyltransferase family A protein [Candidatus Thorarchaeota archaeon]|jgi:hypothetical protein
MILLTVIIPAIPSRLNKFHILANELSRQMENQSAELLCLVDNKVITVGDKCNRLVSMARGLYVTGMGDDDWVEPDYVSSICKSIAKDPTVDVVCFDTTYQVDNEHVAYVYWGIGYSWQDKFKEGVLWRPPFDRMAIRREHLITAPKPALWHRSDQEQMRALQPLLKRETRIEKTLAHHRVSSKDKPCLLDGKRVNPLTTGVSR